MIRWRRKKRPRPSGPDHYALADHFANLISEGVCSPEQAQKILDKVYGRDDTEPQPDH